MTTPPQVPKLTTSLRGGPIGAEVAVTMPGFLARMPIIVGFGSLAALKLVSAFDVRFELPPHYIVLTIAGAVAVALLAALYPARRAAQAQSAESIHYE